MYKVVFTPGLNSGIPAMSVCCSLVDNKSIAIRLSVGCTCRQDYINKRVLECEMMWKQLDTFLFCLLCECFYKSGLGIKPCCRWHIVCENIYPSNCDQVTN